MKLNLNSAASAVLTPGPSSSEMVFNFALDDSSSSLFPFSYLNFQTA